MSVIYIKVSTDLPTRAQNKLRYAIELGIWREAWREAEYNKDYAKLDRLDLQFNCIGLP